MKCAELLRALGSEAAWATPYVQVMPTGIALELEEHEAAKRQCPSPPDVMSGFLEELQALFLSLCFPLSQNLF